MYIIYKMLYIRYLAFLDIYLHKKLDILSDIMYI